MKNIFVGCSSAENITDKTFFYETEKVAHILGEKKYNLVFGACNYGLMGVVYRTMLSYGSNVIGVAPEIYKDDFKELNCTEEYVTKTVDERSSILINRADLILFLPGGTGTLEELMTAIEMKRRKEIDKPIIIYDINDFYLPFIHLLKEMDRYKFSSEAENLIKYINNTETLKQTIDNLNSWETSKRELKLK